jgi:hypothetical protein
MEARLPWVLAVAMGIGSCGTDPAEAIADGGTERPDASGDLPSDALPDAGPPGDSEVPVERPTDRAGCPTGTVGMDTFCVDRFEAPNRVGAFPLVMYTLPEAEAWCEARARRLCFDDEWTRACEGTAGTPYPYGSDHEPGRCNDQRTWRAFDQAELDAWPIAASASDVDSLEALLSAGAGAAAHVRWLYQADPSGERRECTGPEGVYDLTGNVEEWTRRREGSRPGFSGGLRGRYWAESRTCQSEVTTHGDTFRFYELGFRCCTDRW